MSLKTSDWEKTNVPISFNIYFTEQEVADIIFMCDFLDSVSKNAPFTGNKDYDKKLQDTNIRVQRMKDYHFSDFIGGKNGC